jgi:hypothetical protein
VLRILSTACALLVATSARASPLPFSGEVGLLLPTIGVIVSVPGAGVADVSTNASGLVTAVALPRRSARGVRDAVPEPRSRRGDRCGPELSTRRA